jgi:FADH2 O2-dependent halogenase
MQDNDKVYDVAIIGGGPAGSALASYLAKEGLTCIIIEKEKFPRPHVGESLIPSSNIVFKDLEVFEDLIKAGFIKKYGAAWTTVNSKQVFSHDHDRVKDDVGDVSIRIQQGGVYNYTFHVDRAKFDKILLDKAAGYGAIVLEETTVAKVDFSNTDWVKIIARKDGSEVTIKSKIVADASGRSTMLGRQLKLKKPDPDFNQFAIHTWFKNFDRNEKGLTDFIFIHFLPYQHTWIWQIPITDEITSIGLVTSKKHIDGNRHNMEEVFYSFLSKNFELAERIKKAEKVKPFIVESEYSYSMDKLAGDRWILVGDAARFVDPIFSSGVSIALNGARFAANDIVNAFRKKSFTEYDFKNYTDTIHRGCKNWYDFISLYYELNVLFTYFVSHPEYKMEVIRFLQGDVYDETESFLLREMKRTLTEVQSNEGHIWHKLLNTVNNAKLEQA